MHTHHQTPGYANDDCTMNSVSGQRLYNEWCKWTMIVRRMVPVRVDNDCTVNGVSGQ